jgi:hypothetical protein
VEREMKAKTILFVILMLTVPWLAYAQYHIQFDSEADRVLYLGGVTLRGSWCTRAEAEAYQKSRPEFEQSHSWIVGNDCPRQSSTGNSSGSSSANRDRGNMSTKEIKERAAEKERQKEIEAERQEAFDRAKNELRMFLKEGTSAGVPDLKTYTTALPLKGSDGLKTYDAAAKEKTIKTIKEMNCSAYWGLQAASAALGSKNEVTINLEDKYTRARQYGEYSIMAKDGKTVSGCPEVKISVPDVPSPVEANPQIQIYSYIIQQTRILVPDIIETQKGIEKTKQSLKDIKEASADNRKKTEQLVSKMITLKNGEEKDKMKAKYEENNIKYDELEEQARELEKEATQLNTKADKQGENYAGLQKIYDDVWANPERAKEIAGRLR